MQTLNIILSDTQHETLRRLSFEQRISIAELIRRALDQAYGTEHAEIVGQGGKFRRKDGQHQ